MATIRTSIQMHNGMTPALKNMSNALNIVLSSFESLQNVSSNAIDTRSIQAARQELVRAETAFNGIEQEIMQADQRQQQFNQHMRNGQGIADGLWGKIKGFVAAYAGFEALKKGMEATDNYTNQSARLALINDGMQTQAELQQKIYEAAQRSRGVYGDTANAVAKLGLLAKDAFSSNDETIAFTELMNKSFKVGGASAMEASAGMYQLTQAMASGRLQGDEFRSIIENAPMLAQAIADYTGKSMGELKEMSSEGAISADIIKNALFTAADDINAKFETLPKTFADVWTSIKNKAVEQFEGIMQKINTYLNSDTGAAVIDGISNSIGVLAVMLGYALDAGMGITSFFTSNWSMIEPIIWGHVASWGAYIAVLAVYKAMMIASAVATMISAMATEAHAAFTSNWTMATFMQTAAQEGLNTALLACPITWIIAAVIALIVIFYVAIAAVNKFANKTISATGIIAGAFMVALAFIGNLFVGFWNLVINVVAAIWNTIATFAEFLANVFVDPLGSIIRMFSGMADTVIQIIQGIASAIDAVFGSNLAGAVSGWRSGLKGAVDNLVGEAQVKIPRMDTESLTMHRYEYGSAYDKGWNFGKGLEDKFDLSKMSLTSELDDIMGKAGIPDMTGDIGDIADNTKGIKDKLEISEEDLKYLRDLAEREVIDRTVLRDVKVEVANKFGDIRETADVDGILTVIEDRIWASLESDAEGVY